MKWIVCLILLLSAALLPQKATDVGKLIPVEVIRVSEKAGTIYIDTDTGNRGTGKTLREAISDMEHTASGVIYLDTAEFLILEEGMETAAQALNGYLKKDVRVCLGMEGLELKGVADYLSVHKPEVRLNETGEGGEIPILIMENGRFRLAGK